MAAGVASLAASSKLQVISTGDSALELRLAGEWVVGEPIPPVDELLTQLASGPAPRRIDFDASRLGRWDSLLLTFLVKLIDYCAEHAVEANREGLPQGVQGLLALAYAVPERQGARRESQPVGWLTRIGHQALDASREVINLITFVGEACQGLWAFLLGRARYRRSDLALLIEECGAKALPIVTLISLLVGLILAFVGAMQLKMFGAQIYIADLVGIGMAREMGAMMTGIIMAGRTGAAFAAQLGTMQVNSEIDAFKTLGVSPVEFLVLPRMLALILDDAALVPVRRCGRDARRGAGLDRPLRHLPHGVYTRDTSGLGLHRFRRGPRQGRGVRRHRRHRRLHARHAMRAQLLGRRPRRDLRGGDRDRLHRRLRRPHDDHHDRPGYLMMASAHITVINLTMAYGDFVIQRDLRFTIARGDIFIIMGGSGCGKSTLLQASDRTQSPGTR